MIDENSKMITHKIIFLGLLKLLYQHLLALLEVKPATCPNKNSLPLHPRPLVFAWPILRQIVVIAS